MLPHDTNAARWTGSSQIPVPQTAAQLAGEIEGAGGGWAYVLSDLKSLLETGRALEVGA